MYHHNLVRDTLLLVLTSLVDDMKDNKTGSSTLGFQSQLWKLNQDALRVRNIYKMGYLSLAEYQHLNTGSKPSEYVFMTMT